jgi:hypothetical protein
MIVLDDFAEATSRFPILAGSGDLIVRSADEVPPHQEVFVERFSAD